jgi:DNA-binding CsgD family transcriptional regulator
LAGDPKGPGLVGRSGEFGLLEGLLQQANGGQSRVLVLRGEPGIGKTALLEHAMASVSGWHVARATGVESEMEIPFAGLHQLCAPMLNRLGLLPEPQRDALRTAFGLASGSPPDRFLIGLASLSLLTDASEEAPLLCVVDDAQWLDQASAQALAFVARRLLADRVCLLFGTREVPGDFKGLPELVLDGLDDAAARQLLASVMQEPLDDRVREQMIAETHGNPLALLEWPRWFVSAEFGGGFGRPALVPVAGQVEKSFRRRMDELPPSTRLFLTVAAADPTGDAALVWRAAGRLGARGEDAAPAIEAGLVEVGTRVRFRHPSVRSAAYGAAAVGERLDAHRALADATDPVADPDRRAWHLALATAGPDEEVAAELERSAGRARARGGLAAWAALLERSAALTLEPAQRVRRTIDAAGAHLEAGGSEAAAGLLATAEVGPLDELSRARVELLRGGSAIMWGESRDSVSLLLSAAKRLERIDPNAARNTYMSALMAAATANSLAPVGSLERVAKAAQAATATPTTDRAHDLLLHGLATVVTDGPGPAAATLRRALDAFRGSRLSENEGWWYGYQTAATTMLWDYESFLALSASFVQHARDVGALRMLPTALDAASMGHILGGDLAIADSLVGEAESLVEATRSDLVLYGGAMLAGYRGRQPDADHLISAKIGQARARGQGIAIGVIQSARATLYNGLGRHDDALVAARELGQAPPSWTSLATYLSLHELVEAASRTGQQTVAAKAVERLAETTRPSGTPWAIGIEARSRAMLRTGGDAEGLYLEAIEHLESSPVRPEAARAHLLFGEWLRRQNRRVEARQHFRVAYESLTSIGMDAFAERARRELQATGETARKRRVDTSAQLTPQEAQVANLARAGLSNREIGSRLFISAHTVQYHLSKVFAKLGITSRSQLDQRLPNGPPTVDLSG